MRNTRLTNIGQNAGRIVAATGLCLTFLAGPLIQSASAQNVGGQIIKVLGGSDSRQGEKNAMRNLGIGLGAAAAYEAINHRGTHALILGAGAALAGKRYEDVRKTQSKENNRFAYDADRRRDHDRDNRRNDRDNDWRRDKNEWKREQARDRREDRRERHDHDRDDWRRSH